MPQKGHYTACVCVLFDQPVEIDDVIRSLRNFDLVGRSEDPDPEAWMFGGPSVAIAYRPEVNGLVVVDAVNQPWPDNMGDPKNAAQLFGAWSMGFFGPFTFPDALSRSTQQSWVWPGGKEVAEKQTAFVRIRVGYAFGTPDDAPLQLIPDNYNAAEELRFATNVAGALLEMSGAICYFNPSGEVLRDSSTLDDALRYADSEGIPPLDAWCNVRLANAADDWLVMDTCGNQQLDIPDIELGFKRDKGYDLTQVDGFLRNITEYLLANGEVIKDGDTMDGLGTSWTFHKRKTGILMPPRPTLRAFPQDGNDVPAELMNEREE
jgi:hypothetical protein